MFVYEISRDAVCVPWLLQGRKHQRGRRRRNGSFGLSDFHSGSVISELEGEIVYFFNNHRRISSYSARVCDRRAAVHLHARLHRWSSFLAGCQRENSLRFESTYLFLKLILVYNGRVNITITARRKQDVSRSKTPLQYLGAYISVKERCVNLFTETKDFSSTFRLFYNSWNSIKMPYQWWVDITSTLA